MKTVTIKNTTIELDDATVKQLEEACKEYHAETKNRPTSFNYLGDTLEGGKTNYFNLEIQPNGDVVFGVWDSELRKRINFCHGQGVYTTLKPLRAMVKWLEKNTPKMNW